MKCGGKKLFLKHHIQSLGAKWRYVPRICEPQITTLSHIKPQRMWGQVEPKKNWRHIELKKCGATLSHFEPLCAKWRFYDKWSISTVPQYFCKKLEFLFISIKNFLFLILKYLNL